MSRADRRADKAARERFKRKTGGNVLVHLFQAGERVEGRPFAGIITKAIDQFYREPCGCCFACKGDYGRGAAFLVAHAAVNPTSAALAVACSNCWSRDDYLDALSEAAEVTLRTLVPGHWLEPLHDTS